MCSADDLRVVGWVAAHDIPCWAWGVVTIAVVLWLAAFVLWLRDNGLCPFGGLPNLVRLMSATPPTRVVLPVAVDSADFSLPAGFPPVTNLCFWSAGERTYNGMAVASSSPSGLQGTIVPFDPLVNNDEDSDERFGECETKTAYLKPGWRYAVTLSYSGTDPEYNDYPRSRRAIFEAGSIYSEPDGEHFTWSGQYADKVREEEEFHLQQLKGLVPDDQGGQGDCFTTKGIKYFITQQAVSNANIVTSTWIVKGTSKQEAEQNADMVINEAVANEIRESFRIRQADRGFREYTVKQRVNFNAAFRYHCAYEQEYGPRPANNVHPAYAEGGN